MYCTVCKGMRMWRIPLLRVVRIIAPFACVLGLTSCGIGLEQIASRSKLNVAKSDLLSHLRSDRLDLMQCSVVCAEHTLYSEAELRALFTHGAPLKEDRNQNQP